MTWKASRWKEVVILCGLSLLARASLGAECKNRINELGLGSAILRGEEIKAVERLKEVMAKEKYQDAFKEILDKDELLDRWPEVQEKINRMTQNDLKSYRFGTQFEWMAYRRKKDRKISLLKDSCWTGTENLDAWTFVLKVDGQDRTFIIPTKCLNLTLLKDRPPSCTLDASINCEKSQATITASATADGKAKITSVTLSASPELTIDQPEKTVAPYSWTVDISSGSYQFSAEAKDSHDQKSPACTVKVAVCEKPRDIPPCKSPSCDLKVTGDWPKGTDKGTISISAGGGPTDRLVIKLDGRELSAQEWEKPISVAEPRDYKVELVVQPADKDRDKGCEAAKCSTTVHIASPPPCCESPWFLRAFGTYADAQGSELNGTFTTHDRKTGLFTFDFNEGLGFGLELERLFTKDGNSWDAADWGWTFELLRVNLDTIWVFDPDGYWIMDDDRVPLTALMTGINYHIRQPKWDFFIGPRIGFVRFEDGTYADATIMPGTFKASFEDGFAYGANLGFDAFLGECWGLTGGVEYLKVSTEADFLDVDVDPLVVKAGFVYHF